MDIKTVGDLRKLISSYSDDFKLELNIMERLTDEQLAQSIYPFPWRSDEALLSYHDTGYSDKVLVFGVYRKSEVSKI